MSAEGYAKYLIEKLKTKRPIQYQEQNRLWEQILSRLRSNMVSEIEIDVWFKDISVIDYESNSILIACVMNIQYDMIISKYIQPLKDAVKHVLDDSAKLYIMNDSGVIFDAQDNVNISYDDYTTIRGRKMQDTSSVQSNKNFIQEYTFDTFVVGSSNRFAHAGAFAVAENPAFINNDKNEKQAYNPLFIYGGSGLGKTHLLYAIMNRVREKFPDANILYIKGDEFTNELILAIQNSEQLKFRSKYRYVDVLLVDDIQFIGGRISTQEEFFHTFNSLHEANKQIILTSDRPPKEMLTLEERLVTRFVWGLTADIQPPDFETRVAIINRKAQSLNVDLGHDVTMFIANNVQTNIRQIEGAVKKLKAYNLLTNTPIDINSVQGVLKDIISEVKGAPITIESIIEEISGFFVIPVDEICGKKRTANIVNARQISMYIARELTDMSLPQIGAVFDRDHSTVHHAITKVESEIKVNPKQKQIIEDMIKNLKEN